MPFNQYVVTLTGAAQRLSDAIPLTAITDIPFRTLTFQAGKANTTDVLVGDAAISSTLYAFRLDPADTAPPVVVGGYDSGPLKLQDFWVFGTNGEKIHIGGVAC